jgi:hypothetical protein
MPRNLKSAEKGGIKETRFHFGYHHDLSARLTISDQNGLAVYIPVPFGHANDVGLRPRNVFIVWPGSG